MTSIVIRVPLETSRTSKVYTYVKEQRINHITRLEMKH